MIASRFLKLSQWKDAMTLDVAVTDELSDEALEVIGTGLDQFNLEAAG